MSAYRGKTIVYYASLAALLLLIMTKFLGHILPSGLATSIGHNSESLLFAIGFSAIVQFLLPAMRARRWSPWYVTIPASMAFFTAGYTLLHADLPASVVTLNEPCIAIGFMLLYTSFPRPLRYAPLISVAVLAFVAIFFHTAFVTSQAESLVPLMLAPLSLDVFDRRILVPTDTSPSSLRWAWTLALLVLAIVSIIANRSIGSDLTDWFRVAINYAQRAAEAYWGWILVHLYFGLWIGRLRGWSITSKRSAQSATAAASR